MVWRTVASGLLALLVASCGGGGGGGGGDSSGGPAPVVDLTAAPAAVVAGDAATLNWTATDATYCTGSGGWSGDRGASGTESTGALNATTSYTLSCTGPGGTSDATTSVSVTPPPAPTLAFSIAPTTISAGGSATLSWSTTAATACTASGGWSGGKPLSGTEGTGALSGTATYTLTCTGAGGSADGTVSVTVNPVVGVPSINLAVSPSSISSGAATTLTWTTANVTACTASGGWSGAKGTSGSEGTGGLTSGASYALTCTGPGGSASQSVTVTVIPPPPTLTLSAAPSLIASGASSTLSWSSANATACTASGGWSGSKGTTGNEARNNLTATSTFTLTCTGAGGSLSQSATVVVAPAPTLTLAANPTVIASGNASSLNWTATNASGCTASGGWTGNKATNGSQSTGTLPETKTYTLICTGSGGSVSQSVTVTVAPAPTITLTASPTTVASGAPSALTWSTTNATSCAASGGWSGTKGTSGTASTGNLTATTTYTLACTGAGGSDSESLTVTVTPPAPTVTFAASPATVTSGAASTLTWSTVNATACTASGGWTGARNTSGSEVTGNLTSTTTYTLSCTGPGGTTNRSATVTVSTGGGSSIFPLRVEAGKRYLVDAQGRPFLMHGDTPWCLITQLTETEVDQYLEDRRAKGFNTILIELIENYYSDNAPLNVYGDAPFATGADFATRREAYFSHAEYVIARARDKGMLVLITPAYLGYNGGSQGWYQEMGQAGNTVLQDYGRYVATRFQAYDNILWVHGGDYNPPDRTRMRAVVDGILEIETTPLHTFHGARGTAALQWLGTSETWLDVNNIYTTKDTVIAEAQGEYNRSTMPFFLIEGAYENETASPTETRQQAWQAVLSGATGQLMGEEAIWPFATDWTSQLDTEGASTLTHLRTLLESYSWWTLEPDFANAFLTGGVGTGGGRAPAAVAADGSFAIVYVNTVRALTVNLGALSGSQVQARWYDPTNGSFAEVSGSPFATTGSQAFTPAGNNARGKTDWVLVLENTP